MRLFLVSLVFFSVISSAWSQGGNTEVDDGTDVASQKVKLYAALKKFYEDQKSTGIDPTYQGIGEIAQEIEKGKQALSFLENSIREAEMAIKQLKTDLGEPFVPIDTAIEYGDEYSNRCDPTPKSYSYYRFCYSMAILVMSDRLLLDWDKDLLNFYEAFVNIYYEVFLNIYEDALD